MTETLLKTLIVHIFVKNIKFSVEDGVSRMDHTMITEAVNVNIMNNGEFKIFSRIKFLSLLA